MTDEEKDLGFQRVLIQNPGHEFVLYAPNLLVAVVRVLGPGDRILKVRQPDGKAQYSHQQYGELVKSGENDWQPVLVPYDSPAAAITVAKARLDEALARRTGIGVDPSLPELAMRCADCSHSYCLRVDHLGLDDQVTCPNCKRTRPARQAATYETHPGPGGIHWGDSQVPP